MAPGKQASQAGHAYLGAFLKTQQHSPSLAAEYSAESPGTKVALQGSLEDILRAQAVAEQANIPHYLVVDSGCPDFFNGEPTITAFGFGPATRKQVKSLTKRFNLL
jgi:peptidyl-tRNA hydrolase